MPTSPGSFYPLNPFLGQKVQGSQLGARELLHAYCVHLALTAAQATNGGTTDILGATSAAAAINVSTGFTQPTCPRNVTATTTGTAANVTAQQVIVTGTDETGATISETLPAFTAASLTTVTGSKAFASVTNVSCPTVGASVNVSIGQGNKFGIPHKLPRNTVLKGGAYLNNVREGTDPTVATDSTTLCNNTVLLNSTPSGTPIDVYYLVP